MLPSQLTHEFNDKPLRIEFTDGITEDVLVCMVCECDEHEECRGIVYSVAASSRPGWTPTSQTLWADLKTIRSFVPIGEFKQ